MAYDIYPTPTVKRFYKACRHDEVFKAEMKEIEGDEYEEPKRFSNNKVVVLYAAYYAGYLLGGGQTEKFKLLDNK